MNLFRAFSLSAVVFTLVGCSCTNQCVRSVRCVPACGATPVAEGCISCPAGSFDDLVCRDASTPDAAIEDGSTEDAATVDSGSDAGEEDASTPDAGPSCPPESFVASAEATREQRLAVEAAADELSEETGGVTVTLHELTAAVTTFSGPFAMPNDDTIADQCLRAEASWNSFVDLHQELMRMPADMHVRRCSIDTLTGRAVVRVSGGTYDGSILVGADNDLVIHVSPEGVLHHFGGDYLPVAQRGFPEPCLTPEELAETLFGDRLGYTLFSACRITGTGMVPIRPGDTLNVGEPALFVDAEGGIHRARRIEVLLDATHVTAESTGSDLYCCSGTLEGCVGAWVIVDELSFEILQQSPRCTTC